MTVDEAYKALETRGRQRLIQEFDERGKFVSYVYTDGSGNHTPIPPCPELEVLNDDFEAQLVQIFDKTKVKLKIIAKGRVW